MKRQAASLYKNAKTAQGLIASEENADGALSLFRGVSHSLIPGQEFTPSPQNRMADRAAAGIWFSQSEAEARAYGATVIQVQLRVGKTLRVTQRELDEWAVSVPMQQLKQQWQERGIQFLRIDPMKEDRLLEQKAQSAHWVVLNPQSIKIVSINGMKYDDWCVAQYNPLIDKTQQEPLKVDPSASMLLDDSISKNTVNGVRFKP